MAHAEFFDTVLKLGAVVISSSAIGSALGVSIAVLSKRSPKEIEMCGFKGTACGLLFSLALLLAAAIDA